MQRLLVAVAVLSLSPLDGAGVLLLVVLPSLTVLMIARYRFPAAPTTARKAKRMGASGQKPGSPRKPVRKRRET
jgi:hypothetical protein